MKPPRSIMPRLRMPPPPIPLPPILFPLLLLRMCAGMLPPPPPPYLWAPPPPPWRPAGCWNFLLGGWPVKGRKRGWIKGDYNMLSWSYNRPYELLHVSTGKFGRNRTRRARQTYVARTSHARVSARRQCAGNTCLYVFFFACAFRSQVAYSPRGSSACPVLEMLEGYVCCGAPAISKVYTILRGSYVQNASCKTSFSCIIVYLLMINWMLKWM